MSQHRPFDLSKLDFEGIRKRKRKLLIKYSLLPVIVVLIVALKLSSTYILNNMALSDYKAGSYKTSIEKLWPLKIINRIEPYVVYFNQGNAYFKIQQYAEAKKSFERSLILAPSFKHCDIHVNIVLTAETAADQKLDQKNYDEAIVLYDEAKAALEAGSRCFRENNNTEQSKKLISAEERIKKKSDQSKQERNNDKPSSGDQKNQQDTKDELTEEQQKELEKIQEEAQGERHQDRRYEEQQKRDRSEGSDKPW